MSYQESIIDLIHAGFIHPEEITWEQWHGTPEPKEKYWVAQVIGDESEDIESVVVRAKTGGEAYASAVVTDLRSRYKDRHVNVYECDEAGSIFPNGGLVLGTIWWYDHPFKDEATARDYAKNHKHTEVWWIVDDVDYFSYWDGEAYNDSKHWAPSAMERMLDTHYNQ